MQRVKKRNGTYELWTDEKLTKSISAAILSTEDDVPLRGEGLKRIVETVKGLVRHKDYQFRTVGPVPQTIEVNDIAKAVEETLMGRGYYVSAKAYIVYRERNNEELLEPDNTLLGDYIHGTKYARYLGDKKRRETYGETVDRWFNQHVEFLAKEKQLTLGDEIVNLVKNAVLTKRVLPSMRAFQFGGDAILTNHVRQYNCAFIRIEHIDVFKKILYMLLCGCGVGYSVQFEHVEYLPVLKVVDKKQVQHHQIEDTIEGWANALDILIKSYMDYDCNYSGQYVEFDYSAIRAEGSPLVTSGGKAPGHLALKETLEQIRSILDAASGRKLRPIECHDIACWIALSVLSGGIRRSSLMCLFSADDTEMLYCKAYGNFRPKGTGDLGYNSQREMANNSGVILRDDKSNGERLFRRLIAVGQQNFGDPGFVFLNHVDEGVNPCAEIGLRPLFGSAQFCNLCEINGTALTCENDFLEACKVAAIIGTWQAAYVDFPFLGEGTEESTAREALLGVSIMGIFDNLELLKTPGLLKRGVDIIRETNREWAKRLGIKPAARLTTIKPGGTAPLEAASGGVIPASGITPHHAPAYFRRVTANRNEPLAQALRQINPHLVEDMPNGDWSITFPIKTNGLTLADVSTMEHIKTIEFFYEHWVLPGTECPAVFGHLTHNVSCTVVVDNAELDVVTSYLWDNRWSFAAMSFVPPTLDKDYRFAPRESVSTLWDGIRWNRLVSMTQPMDFTEIVEDEDVTALRDNIACGGGACEL